MPSLSLNNIKPDAYNRWLLEPSMQRLCALEASWLRSWVKQLHGHHLAYTGIDPTPRFLRFSRTRHCFKLGFPWSMGATASDVYARDEEWPFSDESLDVIIMQHSLDMSRQPHQLLREANRTLVAGGYIIIMGFNPYGLWGGWRWLHSFSPRLPWITRPLSSQRLQDWLTLLDLKTEQVYRCGHLWPTFLGAEPVTRQVDRVLAGTQWLPANLYLLVARKTIAGLTPIRQQRSRYQQASFGLPVAVASSALPKMNHEK